MDNAPDDSQQPESPRAKRQEDIRRHFLSVSLPASVTLDTGMTLGGGKAFEESVLPAPPSASHACEELARGLTMQPLNDGDLSLGLRLSAETKVQTHQMYQELMVCEDMRCPFEDDSLDSAFKMIPACIPADCWCAQFHLRQRVRLCRSCVCTYPVDAQMVLLLKLVMN